MRCNYSTVRTLAAAMVSALLPVVGRAQATDTLPQTQRTPSPRTDSAGYDLAMGAHIGEPAGWSFALGAERYRHDAFRHATFLLIEPGQKADRISLGTGMQTGDDLASAIATNIRASYLRVRTSRPHAHVGNYGGAEAQLVLLGVGARLGVFIPGLRQRPIVTIDASLNY